MSTIAPDDFVSLVTRWCLGVHVNGIRVAKSCWTGLSRIRKHSRSLGDPVVIERMHSSARCELSAKRYWHSHLLVHQRYRVLVT